MPANVAHMLIAHKAFNTLKSKGIAEFTEFAELLDQMDKVRYRAYMNLGSMGPDLFYYSNMKGAIKDMLVDGYVQSKGVEPWSYHLHAKEPNQFVLNLVEVMFSDVIWEKGKVKLEQDDFSKLAYIAGHLCHIAADQIIHPIVNSVAGPYYRSGENRKKHRECEIFQDYFLYTEVYRLEDKSGKNYEFFEQDFRGWADCVTGLTFKNTHDWFRYLLQRGFVESYGISPTEQEIEDSVDNLLATLEFCKYIGPYKTAEDEYKKKGTKGDRYKAFIADVDYLKHYRIAVELAVVYLIALYEIYYILNEGRDFSEKQRKRFFSIVRDADLSCPLEKDILGNALAALKNSKLAEKFVKDHTCKLITSANIISRNWIVNNDCKTVVNA